MLSALSGIALVLLGGNAQGGYQAIGDDGIAASPKLRQQLDEHRMNLEFVLQLLHLFCICLFYDPAFFHRALLSRLKMQDLRFKI